ncbi:MAG: type II CAAX endopeptidase family protein [Candidatus Omnitrophica bacterium]|nr:type II CAAX endopeptidase family protein [Candidatus Omnitrophota bacterium]
MKKIAEFIRRERLYILLLIFVLLVSAITSAASGAHKKQKKASASVMTEKRAEDASAKEARVEKLLTENKPLAVIFTIASLLIMLVLFLGIAIDIALISGKISGNLPDIRTFRPLPAAWGLTEVARVVILFLFFGYIIVMIESFLVRMAPILKNGDLRMVFNSAFLDGLTIIFIIYFTVQQYGQKLSAVGINFKNFAANVFYGIVGYIAILPSLFLILVLTTIVTNLMKYTPKEQIVVELFMRQDNPAFLVLTSIFAAIAGPIVEELFFRGFLYGAVKKYTGIFWATMITAALFAALHAHAVGFLPIMALGILLAYLYEKTGTLVSSMTVHVMHNFSMVLLVFLAKSVKGM